jgi:hypothetical protein
LINSAPTAPVAPAIAKFKPLAMEGARTYPQNSIALRECAIRKAYWTPASHGCIRIRNQNAI